MKKAVLRKYLEERNKPVKEIKVKKENKPVEDKVEKGE